MTTTFSVEQAPPAAFRFQHSSPLEALVRRTSAKRARAVVQSTASSQQYPLSLIDEYAAPQIISPQDERDINVRPSGGYATSEILQVLPNRPFAHQQAVSPLLHSHFARNSTTSVSVAGSYSDLRSSIDPRNVYPELEFRNHSQVNSLMQAAPQGSQRPGARPEDYSLNRARTTTSPKMPGIPTAVPTIVVSSPDVGAGNGGRAGRLTVVNRITPNFSRPVRPSSQSEQYTTTLQQIVALPHKSRVLERNTHCTASPSEQHTYSQQQMKFLRRSKSPTLGTPASPDNPYLGTLAIHVQQAQPMSPTSADDILPRPYAEQSTTTSIQPCQSNRYRGTSSGTSGLQTPPSGRQPFPSSSPSTDEKVAGLPPTALPRYPPVGGDYSDYSYYHFEDAEPSPENSEPPPRASPAPQQPSNAHLQPSFSQSLPQQPKRSSGLNNNLGKSSPLVGNSTTSGNNSTSTPQDFLQLGIQNHEANRLRESAMYFEKSAKENGGCGGGMLMWGLTLRHGWGCEKNEKVGFKWLSKAAESAVADLETTKSSNRKDTQIVKEELVLAIYEVGQCFFHGWGTNKDQKMAVVCFHLACIQGSVLT